MNLLLDTHTLLWLTTDPDQLSAQAKTLLVDPQNKLIVSIATLWEIAIKSGVRNNNLPVSDVNPVIKSLDEFRISLLPLKPEHFTALQLLPRHHRDPFDRIVVAQAQVERLPLLTVDEDILKYPIWCIS